MHLVTAAMDASDEELVLAIAEGREEAVGPLYARYAPLVLGMASQALGRPTAEEVVQDVFLAVWKNAGSFDPSRGPVRPWLLQIAHYRIANELRTRSRRPRIEPDPEGERVAALPDPAPDQQAAAWTEYRRSALKRALEELPAPQRQALGLAFYQELSHGEIARVLKLPLGTAKSRLRAGLLALRGKLAPLVASLAILAVLSGVVYELTTGRREASRNERAVAMLTSSEAQALRLTPAPGAAGVPPAAHAVYRFQPGKPIGVITYSFFARPPAGRAYQAWALIGGRWVSLGVARPDGNGHARLVAEDPALATRPEAVQVTLEPEAGSALPAGALVVSWRSP
jgi:RNA polymerase sigma-70 factor (ECF subfamily)